MQPPNFASGEPPQYPSLPPLPPIFDAASKCDYAKVARLLGNDPSLVNAILIDRNDRPLHQAAEWGCTKVVELLLDHGAQIDAPDNALRTPLHRAAEKAKTRVVQILLRKGADPNAVDAFGFTPLVSAARRFDAKGYKTARAILSEGVECDLHGAVCLADVSGVQSLLQKSPGLPRTYPIPGDLLFDAILMVLSRTEDFDASTNTLEQSIRDYGPICELLVSHGVSPNETSRWSGPPLHDNLDDECLVQFLIDLGADVNLRGPSGERPLQIAERAGRILIAKLLRDCGAH